MKSVRRYGPSGAYTLPVLECAAPRPETPFENSRERCVGHVRTYEMDSMALVANGSKHLTADGWVDGDLYDVADIQYPDRLFTSQRVVGEDMESATSRLERTYLPIPATWTEYIPWSLDYYVTSATAYITSFSSEKPEGGRLGFAETVQGSFGLLKTHYDLELFINPGMTGYWYYIPAGTQIRRKVPLSLRAKKRFKYYYVRKHAASGPPMTAQHVTSIDLIPNQAQGAYYDETNQEVVIETTVPIQRWGNIYEVVITTLPAAYYYRVYTED